LCSFALASGRMRGGVHCYTFDIWIANIVCVWSYPHSTTALGQTPRNFRLLSSNKQNLQCALKRNGEKTISYIAEDWDEAYSFVRTTIGLAGQYAIGALEEKLSRLRGFDKAVQEWEEDLISEWLS